MKLEYNGQEKVQATTETVWKFIQDPNKVASCLPDLKSVDIKDERNMVATVSVAVGPVRGV
jgi:uncharacterized protein